jgi:hypothetical protein
MHSPARGRSVDDTDSGRREAAEFFFGDYPRAVQDAERAVQEFCAGQ